MMGKCKDFFLSSLSTHVHSECAVPQPYALAQGIQAVYTPNLSLDLPRQDHPARPLQLSSLVWLEFTYRTAVNC